MMLAHVSIPSTVSAPLRVAHPVRSGTASLAVERVSGVSAVTSVRATSPLKLLIPRTRGSSVWAFVSSLGGGLVAGDETSVDVRLGAKTRCFLSTQASTKVYRNPDSRPCGHHLVGWLDSDSLLVLAPDPVQAFAGSRYAQHQEFHLQPGAGLVLVDWLSSGRSARGERWAFAQFRSRNEVFFGDERRLVDSLLLDPADGKLDSAQRLGRFNCLALIALFGNPMREAAARLLDEEGARPVGRRARLISSGSPLREGALLRLAGESTEEVADEIHRRLGFLFGLLDGDPWSRKW